MLETKTNKIHGKYSDNNKHDSSFRNSKFQAQPKVNSSKIKCYRCGNDHLANNPKCPALNISCNLCKIKGNYAKYCKIKTKVMKLKM